MTVRAKLFISMAVLVASVSFAYIGTTQGFLGALFGRFLLGDAGAASGIRAEQLDAIRSYVLEHMESKALAVTLYTAAISGVIGYWFSGMLVRPLRRLIAVMERVAGGELDAALPVRR